MKTKGGSEFSMKPWIEHCRRLTFLLRLRSVKMVGLFLVTTIGIAVLVDLWALFDIRRGLDMVTSLYKE